MKISFGEFVKIEKEKKRQNNCEYKNRVLGDWHLKCNFATVNYQPLTDVMNVMDFWNKSF